MSDHYLPVKKRKQLVFSPESPPINDVIEEAEIPRLGSASEGDDEPLEMEENLHSAPPELEDDELDVPLQMNQGAASGNGINGDEAIPTNPFTNRSTLEAFSFVEDLGLAKTLGAVTSPSMMLLVAQSTVFECLWCAQTTCAMLAHAGARSLFFASKHARLGRERDGHLALLSS